MRTKRDECLDLCAEATRDVDAMLAELRSGAWESLSHPRRPGALWRLAAAGVLLPLAGVNAVLTDALPGIVRRSRLPELDEPAGGGSPDRDGTA